MLIIIPPLEILWIVHEIQNIVFSIWESPDLKPANFPVTTSSVHPYFSYFSFFL